MLNGGGGWGLRIGVCGIEFTNTKRDIAYYVKLKLWITHTKRDIDTEHNTNTNNNFKKL